MITLRARPGSKAVYAFVRILAVIVHLVEGNVLTCLYIHREIAGLLLRIPVHIVRMKLRRPFCRMLQRCLKARFRL